MFRLSVNVSDGISKPGLRGGLSPPGAKKAHPELNQEPLQLKNPIPPHPAATSLTPLSLFLPESRNLARDLSSQ